MTSVFNYAKNKSKVLSLASGLEFLQLARVQGGVSIGGKPGEPYGVIRGKDHIYVDGQPMVYTTADAPSGSYVGVYDDHPAQIISWGILIQIGQVELKILLGIKISKQVSLLIFSKEGISFHLILIMDLQLVFMIGQLV